MVQWEKREGRLHQFNNPHPIEFKLEVGHWMRQRSGVRPGVEGYVIFQEDG